MGHGHWRWKLKQMTEAPLTLQVKGKGTHTWYSTSLWNITSEALSTARVLNGSHSFSCTPIRSSAIGMSHTCLCLPSYSWYSFTYPGGMEGWVGPGGWLHSETVYMPEGSHPSHYWPGSMQINGVDRDQRVTTILNHQSHSGCRKGWGPVCFCRLTWGRALGF